MGYAKQTRDAILLVLSSSGLSICSVGPSDFRYSIHRDSTKTMAPAEGRGALQRGEHLVSFKLETWSLRSGGKRRIHLRASVVDL